MSEFAKKLTREEFYNLVWSKPFTALSKEFAYSDNGLRKICIKHNIPYPKSGHWSKIKFNKKVKREKLPKVDDSTLIELIIRKEGQESINHPNSERAKIKREIQSNKELSLKVPDRLSNPHKYSIATKEYHEKAKIRHTKRDWSMVLDTSNVLSISVSDSLFARALRIMDTLLKIFEKRGYKISTTNQTQVIIKEQTYNLRIIEKNKRVKRETNRSWDVHDLVPTGNLALKISTYIPLNEWADSKTKPLEEKLVDILAWLELRAEEDRKQQIERDIWHRKYQEGLQREAELKKLKEQELSKFKELLSMATRWNKAEYLRNFIKELESKDLKLQFQNEVIEDTIQWAKEKADWYDPLIEKEDKLLENVDKETLTMKYKRNW